MTDTTARAAALLSEHRDAIDRLDAILVYTLAERLGARFERMGLLGDKPFALYRHPDPGAPA